MFSLKVLIKGIPFCSLIKTRLFKHILLTSNVSEGVVLYMKCVKGEFYPFVWTTKLYMNEKFLE